MKWPIQPVEIQRRFVPTFCPNRQCPAHRRAASERFDYSKNGWYARKDGRRVPRYLCSTCGTSPSKQTYSTTYYLKRPELLVPVAAGLQAGSAHRQLARSLHCAASTVTRLSARLGRHALLFQAFTLEHLSALEEPVVFDHFEVFARRQDYPFGVGTPIGYRSWFLYGIDAAPHAPSGRRSPAQRRLQRMLEKVDYKGGYAGSVRRTLDLLLGIAGQTGKLRLISDGHEDYRRVLASGRYRERVLHRVHPNPKRGPKGSARSAQARRRDAAMFPSDQLHKFLRHTVAHHRRETIAFGRRLNAVMERMFLTVVWKNFIKGVSERKPDPTTPAMRCGLTTAVWSWPRVLARRLFLDRLNVPEAWRELYRREWITPGGPNSKHRLVRAF